LVSKCCIVSKAMDTDRCMLPAIGRWQCPSCRGCVGVDKGGSSGLCSSHQCIRGFECFLCCLWHAHGLALMCACASVVRGCTVGNPFLNADRLLGLQQSRLLISLFILPVWLFDRYFREPIVSLQNNLINVTGPPLRAGSCGAAWQVGMSQLPSRVCVAVPCSIAVTPCSAAATILIQAGRNNTLGAFSMQVCRCAGMHMHDHCRLLLAGNWHLLTHAETRVLQHQQRRETLVKHACCLHTRCATAKNCTPY
jgi:hypothetical protein